MTIRTNDGACATYVAIPQSGGPFPAVIFYMDAGGIRPTILAMADRLANAGYVVLMPDLFYRHGPYGPLVPKDVFAGDWRAVLGPLMASTGNDKAAMNTAALLAYVDARGDIAGTRVGAVGFCMGAGMALASAGTYPDRFAAVASFHGSNRDGWRDEPASIRAETRSRDLYRGSRKRRQLSAGDGGTHRARARRCGRALYGRDVYGGTRLDEAGFSSLRSRASRTRLDRAARALRANAPAVADVIIEKEAG